MREIVQNIEELTDSRELLESKPHPIASVSVYILLLLIISFLIWSYFSEKEIVVKANGIIRPYKEFIISNKVTGNVEKIYVTDGQKVKKGDVLYVIEHKNLELQKSILEKQLANKISEVENLKKLKNSIQDGKNYFDKSSENEMYYYYKYLDFYINKKAIESQLYGINVQAQNIDNILENLKNLKKSIDQNENKINNDTSYYNQFVDYQMNINQRQDKIEQLQNALTQKYYDAENTVQNAKDDLISYQNQYMLSLKSNIEQNEEKLKEIKANLNNVNVEKFTADTIAQIEDNIYSDEKEIEKLKGELQNINLAIEDYIIKSPANGKIDMITSIKEGDLIQSGLEMVKIIPDNSEYIVKLYIPNKDIADIKVGQKIKYHILALPYQEYGELSGEIVKLSIDSRLDKQSGLNYYEAEATIDNKPLYNRKGEKKNIKVGMIVEAHVIGHREKMLYYLLEQLNLKD
ncbi:putative bacteriocin ABC transporter, bacteriocin-binding protein [Thermoanaerobacter kivui]|uniref:Putative bacteriocin ABC transporter, bacteriocin-binding protein n=1 Tax=Thermoanaerobacter kivui TaxID=2325 RepID=A0A097AQ93_THEKI|nr:HlyD family efflux transporter periplasmic adaptor subunit [Thermoanaerobacter kivui]AIS51985.1 putative bacteriocin ABC transporter, bacteriocin-binding protein [Thermoanaerobacter kivui]